MTKRQVLAATSVLLAAVGAIVINVLTDSWGLAAAVVTGVVVLAAMGVAAWEVGSEHTGGDPDADLDRVADQLRDDVRARAWRAVSRLRLQQPALIEVSWRHTERRVQPSEDVLGIDPAELEGTVTQVPDVCRRLPLHQLVVLGDPESGKSALATWLIHDMTSNRRPDDPVPVLMPLSSWRPAVRMRTWIIRQIEQHSPELTRAFGADAAARLFDARKVMPVLDGLDELPEQLRAKAVEAIDAEIPTGCWLLVTCRGDEYVRVRERGSHLTRAAVVELEEVDVRPAITYLDRSRVTGDDRWVPVFDAMHRDPESLLARTMASPLMLYLAQTTYRASDSDPAELLSREEFSTRAHIEDSLLSRYLPAVYREQPSSRYKRAQAERYLELIARQMRRDGTVDFAWWQLNSRMVAPSVGLVAGGTWGWFLHVLFGSPIGVFAGVSVGVASVLAHALIRSDLKQVYVPRSAVHGPPRLLARYRLLGVAMALAVAMATGTSVAVWLAQVLDADESVVWRCGTLVGTGWGVATLLGSAWGTYQVSRLRFWLAGRLPWRLPRFLEDAHELGVLRQTGAVHQFRHERVLRHIGGSPDAEPSRSAHGHWDARWQRWRPLLPAFAGGVQVGSALLALALVSALYGLSTKVELGYRSGNRPSHYFEVAACAPGTTCPRVDVWSWDLPRRSSRHTVWLPKRLHDRSLISWDGRIAAEGCARGSVEVKLAIGREAPVVFTLEDSTEAPMPDLAQPVPPARRPVSLTLRRLDDQPCSLLVEWTGPGLIDDGLEPARKRLGGSADAALNSP